jgi:hypothetical protein
VVEASYRVARGQSSRTRSSSCPVHLNSFHRSDRTTASLMKILRKGWNLRVISRSTDIQWDHLHTITSNSSRCIKGADHTANKYKAEPVTINIIQRVQGSVPWVNNTRSTQERQVAESSV